MKLKNSSGKVNTRRRIVLTNLQLQLEQGLKQPKGTFLALDKVQLSEKDIRRIKNEISILQTKTTSFHVARSMKSKIYRGPGR